MGEQISCSTNAFMLQKLLTFGTFLIREGADMAAAGMLLGGLDTLGRRGVEQDTPDAVSGRLLALVWVFDGLNDLENTKSVFGALRALQVQTCRTPFRIEETKFCAAATSILFQIACLTCR